MSKVELTKICYITTGKLDSNAVEEGGIYPFFTCAPEPLTINTYAFDEDAILLAGNNASGNFHCQRYKGKFNAYQRTYVITAREGYNIDYIYYNLLISLQHLAKISQGSQTKFLTMRILDSFMIDDISFEDQIKQIKILADIDKKILINKEINIQLESIAKMVYDYWFIQFDFPDKNRKPYRSSGNKMVWSEELKKEIPEGWKIGRIDYFIKNDKGGDWGKDREQGNYIKKVICLRGTDFSAIIGSAKIEAPERFILEKNGYKVLKDGDLIIEISGGSPTQSTGRICYINENILRRFENHIITSNFCKALELNSKEFMYWFYIFWSKLYENDVFYKYEGKTTGIKNLLFNMLCEDYKTIIPDEMVIRNFNTKVQKLFETIQNNQLENQELIKLRDFLLPLLINGQVAFKEE